MINDYVYVVKMEDETGMRVNYVFDRHEDAKKFIRDTENKSWQPFAYTYARERLSNLEHYERV